MASATAGVAAGALVAAQDALRTSNGRTSADFASGGSGKKKSSGGGRHVATPAGSARYHLPIGAPLGQGKAQQAGAQASYDTFMACTSKSDMTRNAHNMSNADLTKSADAVFSVKTDNARNQAAQDVLVQELAARGIDPHKYGYDGGPVVVSPNPKADPTVTAQNKVQKAADAAAKAKATKLAKDAAAAAKAKTAADKAAAQQAAQAKAQQAQAASQQAAQAHAAQIQAARDAAAASLINGTESAAKLNAQWQQLMGTNNVTNGKKLTPVTPQTMQQAQSNPGVVRASGLTAGVWAALRHPRDAHGRFISVGDTVHGDGVSGKVEGTKGGKLQVKDSATGVVKDVSAKKVQKIASGSHADAVKGLDHATKGLVDHTAGLLGKEKKASELKPGEAFHHPDGSGVHVTRSVLKPEHTGGKHTSVMSTGPKGTGTADLPGDPPVKVHEGPLPADHPAAPKPAAPKAPEAPKAPAKPVTPPAGWNSDYKPGEPDFLPKEGHQLAQGDLMHAYDAKGSKKTLKVDGVAKNATGHTVTATDRETGQQHTIAVPHGAQVPMAGPHQPVPPLDEKQLAEHVAAVESQVKAAVDAGLSTDAQFSLDGKGKVWAPERAKIHNEIVQGLYAKAANVPNEGKGLFSGGLGGAGKTTTLGNPKTGIDQSQFLTINPDDIKEILAERGMVPEIPGEVKLSPMEKVALIHEESSHIANLLAQLAYADKKNVTWDITMASQESVAKRIAEMKKNGYGNLDAIFVDIPVEGSVTRAMARYQRGMEAYRNGQGLGGRYVPPSVIRKNASTSFSSANRKNFEALRDQFDNWQVWDNSVDKRDPRLVYSKTSPDLPALTAEAEKGLTDADRQTQGVAP